MWRNKTVYTLLIDVITVQKIFNRKNSAIQFFWYSVRGAYILF